MRIKGKVIAIDVIIFLLQCYGGASTEHVHRIAFNELHKDFVVSFKFYLIFDHMEAVLWTSGRSFLADDASLPLLYSLNHERETSFKLLQSFISSVTCISKIPSSFPELKCVQPLFRTYFHFLLRSTNSVSTITETLCPNIQEFF